ncbi:hypothetical protein PJL18_03967 [Paenarthrobacter nicotinovorans]|nr:hypothetical protein [Paenarthrobacter nicotinovorans]
MPPPMNCSPSCWARCWVAEFAPNVMGADSSRTSEPSALTTRSRVVALLISTLILAVFRTSQSPSMTVGVVPGNLSLPTTMLAVLAGSPWSVFAGSVNFPLGSASRRKLPSSRKVTRMAPFSVERSTTLPDWVKPVTAPRGTPAASTGTSGVTALMTAGSPGAALAAAAKVRAGMVPARRSEARPRDAAFLANEPFLMRPELLGAAPDRPKEGADM